MTQRAADVSTSPPWFVLGRALLINAATARATPEADDIDPDGQLEADVTAAREHFLQALDASDAFAVLASNARLSVSEAEVLALLATAEADMHCRRLVTAIHGDNQADRLTLGALALIFTGLHPGPLTLTHSGSLLRSAFVEVGEIGPWTDHRVAVHQDIIWTLLGDVSAGPDLPIGVEYFDAATSDPFIGRQHADDLVVVTGADRMRRRQTGAAHASSERFVCVSPPSADAEWAAIVREATITGRGIMVDLVDSIDPLTRRWLDRATHLVWVLLARTAPPIDQLPNRSWTEIVATTDEPTDEEWNATFGSDVERTHRLTYDQMHRVQRTRSAVGGDIDAAVRRLASGPLEQLTRRITPTRTWDDIILSPDRMALLRSVVDRYQHAHLVYDQWGFAATPSRGLVALFSGPSGTGKTLASEIIAGALGLDVFKLDLSSVVSKYIGETEKNLEQIFDAASAGNMVLFFDEADSLFGKRSEVRDARDRYANIEVSYLLQRLEAYDGLVVLATNFEKNVDEAFVRRIHVRVEFALPGPEERRAIWLTNLPITAPTDEVDIDWLAAQFELSGASIRNASVHAAFAAAAAGTSITMTSAVRGVAAEFRKTGRLLKPKDFGEYFSLVDD